MTYERNLNTRLSGTFWQWRRQGETRHRFQHLNYILFVSNNGIPLMFLPTSDEIPTKWKVHWTTGIRVRKTHRGVNNTITTLGPTRNTNLSPFPSLSVIKDRKIFPSTHPVWKGKVLPLPLRIDVNEDHTMRTDPLASTRESCIYDSKKVHGSW